MNFEELPFAGAFVVELDRIEDERGFFARSFCQSEFESKGLVTDIVQSNISHSRHKGTVRGMHFQVAPNLETKFVRCLKGAIVDVIIDLRPGSETFGQHALVELSAKSHKALYVPQLFAHGFQTLENDTEVMYMVSEGYSPECERGVCYSDPMFDIQWPESITHVSDKDANWPYLKPSDLKTIHK